MLAVQTPAAPKMFYLAASEWNKSLGFAWESSGLANGWRALTLQNRPDHKPQESQDERDANVVRIEVLPEDREWRTGEILRFMAIPYDHDNVTVGGVRFEWKLQTQEPGIKLTRDGEFIAATAGVYRITVTGAGRTEQIRVRVTGPNAPHALRNNSGQTQESLPPAQGTKVSSHDTPFDELSSLKGLRRGGRAGNKPEYVKASYAHAPVTTPLSAQTVFEGDLYGWNTRNYWSADDPGNERGNPPGRNSISTAGSGNFNFSTPIISLPGRGSDLNLGLSYNSRLWHKSKNATIEEITFDIDKGVPAPGWSLGFGTIVNTVEGGAMIVDADGTRHSYAGYVNDDTSNNYNARKIFLGHTTDGTLIEYEVRSDVHQTTGSDWGVVKYPDGTVVSYGGGLQGTTGARILHPDTIKDSNGNVTSITYHQHTKAAGFYRPQIKTIKDTLGRVINFHYDGDDLLTAITTAGPKDANGNSTVTTLVRLQYKQFTLDYDFAESLTPLVRHQNASAMPTVSVVNAIYYPATGTGYWFGDTDSYSPYGMIRKVVKQRGMGFTTQTSTPLNEQGQITQGVMTSQHLYNYPLTKNPSLDDAPTYDTLTVTWEGMDTNPSITGYEVVIENNTRKVTVTKPDGTRSTQHSYNLTTEGIDKFKNGFVFKEELFASNNTLLHKEEINYDPDSLVENTYGVRPLSTESTDERGQKLKTEYRYLSGGTRTQPEEIRYFDYQGVLVRRVQRDYMNNTSYANSLMSPTYFNGYEKPMLVNLLAEERVYSGAADTTLLTRVTYKYDEDTYGGCSLLSCQVPYQGSLVNAPGVVQHSENFNPYYSVNGVTNQWLRGNVTTVTTYSDIAAQTTSVLSSKRTYDITGNVVTTTSAGGLQTKNVYSVDTQYAYVHENLTGSLTNSAAQLKHSATYSFNIGLPLSNTDADGRVTQTAYNPVTWRTERVTLPTNAVKLYEYDDSGMKITESIHTSASVSEGNLASRDIDYFNGLGLLRREESLGAGDVVDVVETKYDKLGRVWQQTLPFRDESIPDRRWNETFYDALGRVEKAKGADGSESKMFYNETSRPAVASTESGQTMRATDAWGRERWTRSDYAGRLVEVVEPNPLGGGSVFEAGSLLTKYTYDTLNNLTEVIQGSQQRNFRYDSLGRVTHQKLAEAKATLNSDGTFVDVGGTGAQWSEVFAYDKHSNVAWRKDARGVKTIFSYDVGGNTNNQDPLNRLQSVSHDLSDVGAGQSIAASPAVNFEYRTKNDAAQLIDIMQPKKVTAGNIISEEFDYDDEGRMKLKTMTFLSRAAYPMSINYSYDSLDRIEQVDYPNQYSSPGAPRKRIIQEYLKASPLSALKVDGAEFATNLSYNPFGQITSIKVGAVTPHQITENYNYDPATGLLNSQTAVRGSGTSATTLQNMTYDYLRANTTGGRTGQVTKVTNHIDRSKDYDYEYDALGRLSRARGGGTTGSWVQRYIYDRYGNRANVLSSRTDQFVANLYYVVFNRAPDASGLQAKDNNLRQAFAQGQAQFLAEVKAVAAAFFDAPDYAARNRSDQDYVTDLYKAYLNRVPSQGEVNAWVAAIATHGRLAVRVGFADSGEFANRVSGMYPGASGGTSTNLSAPSALNVVNTSGPVAGTNGAQVTLSWTAPAGTFDHYEIERRQSGSNDYTVVGSTQAASFTDTTVNQSNVTAYLYRVRAVEAGGVASPYSNIALGTSISYTDDPLQSGVTVIKAQHFNELRLAINAVRQLAGLPAATWAQPSLSGEIIRAEHVQELRDRLSEALSALQLPAATYTDPTLTVGVTNVQRAHVEDLRVSARRGSGAAGTGGTTTTTTTSVAIPIDGWTSLSFDAATNRITSAGWEYDAAGNLTRAPLPNGGAQKYGYDAAGRLVTVKAINDSVLAAYTYGSTNERLISHEGAERTYYVWDDGQVVTEYVEDDASPAAPRWSKNYIYLNDKLLATQERAGSGEKVEFHHPDLLSTRLVTNAASGTHFYQDHLPYGTALNTSSMGGTKRRFTSYDRSLNTGLDYAVNRHYDPLQGRFTQVDPIGMKAADLDNPQSLNLYAYCGNDPINSVDPDGLFSLGGLFRAIGGFLFGGGTVIAINRFPVYQVGGVNAGWSPQMRQLFQYFYNPQQQQRPSSSPPPPPPPVAVAHEVPSGTPAQTFRLIETPDILETIRLMGTAGQVLIQHVAPDMIHSMFKRATPPGAYRGLFSPRVGISPAHNSTTFMSRIGNRSGGNPGPSGRVSTGKYLERNWDRGTFGATKKSIEYHLKKHGKGMSAVEYTQRALKAFRDSSAVRSMTRDLRGRRAIHITSKHGAGLFTKTGKIIWFQPKK
jgi:RHS repeat-associated protein